MYHCFVRHHDGHGEKPHSGPPGFYPPPGYQTQVEVNHSPEDDIPEDPENPVGPAGGWGGPPKKNTGWNRKGRGPTHKVSEGKQISDKVKASNYSGSFVVVGKKEREAATALPHEDSTESFQLDSDNSDEETHQHEESMKGESFDIEPEADTPPIKERDAPLSGLPNNFTKEDFQNARGNTTIQESLKRLGTYGTDITDMNIEKKLKCKAPFQKACFICCNHYTKPSYVLGAGPINDSATVASNHQKRGYQVFFCVNPTPERFLDLVTFFLYNTKNSLTVFFTGHGAQVKDKSGDEDDGFDEAMVFDSGHIVDDDLLVLLEEATPKTLRVLLLTDCCHSGSIWDLQSEKDKKKLPPKVISISAAKDSQTAKQTKMNKMDQGIFTYFFWKILNARPNITPKQLEPIINRGMLKFNQHYTFCAATPAMENQPIFS